MSFNRRPRHYCIEGLNVLIKVKEVLSFMDYSKVIYLILYDFPVKRGETGENGEFRCVIFSLCCTDVGYR